MNIKTIFSITFIALFALSVQAQNIKIGYVQVEKLFSEWPEIKKAEIALQKYSNGLEDSLDTMNEMLKEKADIFRKNQRNMDIATRKKASDEINNFQLQINKFTSKAQEAIVKKESDLVAPLKEKLMNTINQVAEANGFTHIFDGTSLVYATETNAGGEISKLVAKKLGFEFSNN